MNNPILITGIHRSGSTWMGKIFEIAPELRYVHEPFNFTKHSHAPFDTWFYYVNDATPVEKVSEIESYLKSFQQWSLPDLVSRIQKTKYPGQVRDAVIDQIHRKTRRPLFKDPIAIMSSEWFYKHLASEVIVSIRHPAAFVASLKVNDWHFNFENFLKQENLMNDKLFAFKREIEQQVKKRGNITEQGILLWNCVYSVVQGFKTSYVNTPEWSFVRHEDVSLDPLNTFEHLFKKHRLTFTPKVKAAILSSTQSTEKQYLARNSKDNITSWKERLTAEEIARIKEGTKEVWPLFYSEKDWH
jgi:hypothetical protein